MKTKTLEFKVPSKENQLGGGQWVWELQGWPGVHSVELDGMFNTLTVEVKTKKAAERIREFCSKKGFKCIASECVRCGKALEQRSQDGEWRCYNRKCPDQATYDLFYSCCLQEFCECGDEGDFVTGCCLADEIKEGGVLYCSNCGRKGNEEN